MNRRDFLQRLGLLAGAVALSPMLDLAPIAAAPSVAYVPIPGTYGAIERSLVPMWSSMAPLGATNIITTDMMQAWADRLGIH